MPLLLLLRLGWRDGRHRHRYHCRRRQRQVTSAVPQRTATRRRHRQEGAASRRGRAPPGSGFGLRRRRGASRRRRRAPGGRRPWLGTHVAECAKQQQLSRFVLIFLARQPARNLNCSTKLAPYQVAATLPLASIRDVDCRLD